MKKLFLFIFICSLTTFYGQSLTQINPQLAEGVPISKVSILLIKNKAIIPTTDTELTNFYNAFGIRPGTTFQKQVVEMSIKRIEEEPEIASVNYSVFNAAFNGPVEIVFEINYISETSQKITQKGMLNTKSIKDFPVLSETANSKLTFILNGATGFFNEENAFFGQGVQFTQGNPVATNPAGKGTRFWGEAFLEPGIAGITRIGKKQNYIYGAVSVLTSGRNTSDIYSQGSTVFLDFERLYAGVLFTGLSKKKDLIIDFSVGRNFFQLNEAFLISRISGSANAGDRGSVYFSSRTAFQKTALLSINKKNFSFKGFFLEPEELFKNKQTNLNYTGASFNYNNNKNIDAGVSYIATTGGKGTYATPEGSFSKKGMYVVNPKLFLSNIAKTGLFFKSEFAYQSHSSQNMKSNAWYAGIGYNTKWSGTPSIYYRYAFMSGDNPNSGSYGRFDPLLTGGLGNWVQGINFRKVIGNGNIVTHRLELKGNLSKKCDLSIDGFLIRANTFNNIGGLAPISQLKNKVLGHEITLNSRYFINKNLMLFLLYSHANPGKGIQQAFSTPTYNWDSYQIALFLFI